MMKHVTKKNCSFVFGNQTLPTLSTLDTIKKPVAQELRDFEPYFRNSMKTKIPLLGIITNYIYRRKGKQLRPLLVFLSAGVAGKVSQSTFVAASMIELLHTATPIHDDVVDEAYERRGSFSINALWRSKIAVLVGDYLLSKGLLLSIETGEIELLRNMSEAVKEMSEGELLQAERSRRMDIDEETYYEIIRKKTATLLASCTLNGACSAGADKESLDSIKEFGLNLGMAFQIKDDIFDYQSKGILGKPTGNDIKEKKLTLPLIHALSKVDKSTQKRVLAMVRRSKNDSHALDEVIRFAHSNGGVDYAIQRMNEFRNKAKANLAHFPESEYKKSQELLCDYIVDRNQ